MSLDAALPIAEIEHALGLKAHYFVLVRTEMYNLFSAHARDALRRLADLGHEIGLHLDASFYNNDPLALQQAAETECTVLEAATGNPVRTISFHRPAKHLLGYADPLAGRVHAYQPRFFAEMGYCSDSRGAWQNGHPLENAAVREGRGLQLLTHPIWWTGVASSLQHRLNEFLVSRMDTFAIWPLPTIARPKPGTLAQIANKKNKGETTLTDSAPTSRCWAIPAFSIRTIPIRTIRPATVATRPFPTFGAKRCWQILLPVMTWCISLTIFEAVQFRTTLSEWP